MKLYSPEFGLLITSLAKALNCRALHTVDEACGSTMFDNQDLIGRVCKMGNWVRVQLKHWLSQMAPYVVHYIGPGCIGVWSKVGCHLGRPQSTGLSQDAAFCGALMKSPPFPGSLMQDLDGVLILSCKCIIEIDFRCFRLSGRC